MAIEILTKNDLVEFRQFLLQDIKEIFKTKSLQQKQWLKSSEVRKLLNISAGTLQTLRINRTISYTKIGGIIYYGHQDILKVLESNMVPAENAENKKSISL